MAPPTAPSRWFDGSRLPRLIAEANRQDGGGPSAHRLATQRCQRACVTIDAVDRQPSGRGARGENEATGRIDGEGARYRLSCDMSGDGEKTSGGVDGEARNAVVPAIADKKKLRRWRQVDL